MATALETASLVMVPSGYEDGTLGSLQPLDGTGDFTFTRGSNISATRINEDGYIEKGYENLVYYSNAFDAGTIYWDVRLINSIIGGQAGYDGSNDAWRLNRVAGGEFIRSGSSSNVTSVSGVHTCSIYAKANEVEWIVFGYNGIGLKYYHLSGDGSLGNNVASVLSASIESVGNGWYRCSLTGNGTPNGIYLYPANGNGDLGGTGGVYIQDAMLNQGLVAYPYLETTTTTAKGGILEDMPRLDYSGGRCSLLLEPSRTNIIGYSEYRGGGYNVSVEDNSTLSPEGVSNGCLFIENTALNSHGIQLTSQIPINASPVDYTVSVFAKAKEREEIQLAFYADSTSYNSNSFNIVNGTTDGDPNTHKIENYGNGWYRCSFTANVLNSTGGYNLVRFMMFNNSTNYYTGDGTSGLYMWGLQLEAGSYPTSYIPTYGVSQTRLSDECVVAGITSLIGQTEGTLFFDIKDITNLYAYLGVDNGTTGTRIIMYSLNDGKIHGQVRKDGNVIFTNASSVLNGRAKAAVAFNGSESVFYVNGTQVATGNGTTYTNLSNFTFNHSNPRGAEINQSLLFKTRLSDEACIELTTI